MSQSDPQLDVVTRTREEINASHRASIRIQLKVYDKFISRLEFLGTEKAKTQADLKDKSGPDENGRWRQDKENAEFRKSISLSARVDFFKQCCVMLADIIKQERQIDVRSAQPRSSVDKVGLGMTKFVIIPVAKLDD